MSRRKNDRRIVREKKEGFFTKVFNTIVTICLTAGMLWGLQACSVVNDSSLRFAQVSDVHFMANGSNTTFKMIGESPRLLDDAVNQINEYNHLDFVMFTGDQIDKSFEKELRAFLPHIQKLKYPWYLTFGNHDRCIGGYLTTSVYWDLVRDVNPDFKAKKSYYSFEPKKNYKVIVLDNIILDEITSNGHIDDEQLKWLKKELDASKNDIVLIFMHVPLIEPFNRNHHKMNNADEIRKIIEKYKNPIGVFTGHYHAARVTQVNNILYVSSPALVSYPNAFRVVDVTTKRNKVIFNLQFKETNLKNIQKLAKLMVFAGSLYSGEEKDQNAIYEIYKR